MIRSYRGRMPQIPASAYIDPQAVVIGDVIDWRTIERLAVRRDSRRRELDSHRRAHQYSGRLGAARDARTRIRCNWAMQVTVGHGVILHGCTIESRVLIGMGSILLNGAHIGAGSIVAAGTLVPEGTVVPPGSLFMGHPGKFRRALTPEDQASIEAYAARYVEYSETYKAEAGK